MKLTLKKHYLMYLLVSIFLIGCDMMELTLSQHRKPVAVPTPDDIEGFFVQDGRLYDANGYAFQMRGVNANHC